MFLICPACDTRYSIDPTALGNRGKAVRCAKCGHKWHQAPPRDQPREVALAEPEFEEEEDAFEPLDTGNFNSSSESDSFSHIPDDEEDIPRAFRDMPEPQRAKSHHLIGLILLVVVLTGGIASTYFFRNQIVTLWPPSARMYTAVGVPVDALGKGLLIRGVTPEREQDGENSVLIVRGEVVNLMEETRPVPLIRVSLFDAIDRVVQDTTVPPLQPQLAPGQTVGFKARLQNPPDTARRMEVTFVSSTSETKN